MRAQHNSSVGKKTCILNWERDMSPIVHLSHLSNFQDGCWRCLSISSSPSSILQGLHRWKCGETISTMFGASFEVLPFIIECCFAEKRVYSNLLDYDRYNQVLHPNTYNFMAINGVLSSYSFVLETNLSFDHLSVLSSPLRLCLSSNIAFSFWCCFILYFSQTDESSAKNQLQLVALLMRGNQQLVLLLFPTFRCYRTHQENFE